MTVVCEGFEWDSEKEKANVKKHGISFSEILDVFSDPFFFETLDSVHSTICETRFVGIGRANGFVVVTVCYTERKRTRIFSARLASKKEEERYYANIKKSGKN